MSLCDVVQDEVPVFWRNRLIAASTSAVIAALASRLADKGVESAAVATVFNQVVSLSTFFIYPTLHYHSFKYKYAVGDDASLREDFRAYIKGKLDLNTPFKKDMAVYGVSTIASCSIYQGVCFSLTAYLQNQSFDRSLATMMASVPAFLVSNFVLQKILEKKQVLNSV